MGTFVAMGCEMEAVKVPWAPALEVDVLNVLFPNNVPPCPCVDVPRVDLFPKSEPPPNPVDWLLALLF